LTSLNGIDLTGVTKLYCYNNKFTLDGNGLTSIPELPNSLKQLYCDHNQFTLDGNGLTSLPDLPNSLQKLLCNYNNFTETNIKTIKLEQHNQKRKDLGLSQVEEITNDDEIRKKWLEWLYKPDSQKYYKIEKNIL